MRLAAAFTSRASLHALVALLTLSALGILGLAAAGCAPSATAAAETKTTPTSEAAAAPETTTQPVDTSGADLFDTSVVHQITVSFAQEDYDALIQAYQDTGNKEWIKATVTIDGETYENVGMRLKGNSSIMGLRRGAGGMNDAGGANGMGAGPMSGDASFDDPESLPWLIDLDKNVDNQNHDGFVELVVRSNTSETALNEAVSLGLLHEAGLASERAVYSSFSVNGGETALRLVIENPDDMWMADNFSITGALYKAESTGDYSYRGDDPDSYDEVFDQEAGKTNADLMPLIEFLDFINNADDATFNADLPDRLDIDAFATYLAMEGLLSNFDDIDGAGNNSYLYYDTKAEKFTVVAWDHNLAFGGMGNGIPQGMQRPEGMEVPDGATIPRGDQGQAGGQQQADPPGQAGGQGKFRGLDGFGGAKSNILVTRFKANPEWQQLYEDRLAELRTELYESGKAAEILAAWGAVLKTQAADLVDAATVDQEAASISQQFMAE
ncbi:MAG: CotH kinase family protein [Thermoleophilia bacterium]|nr:CotH kinase family protein [Thermoleophilia bacterium]